MREVIFQHPAKRFIKSLKKEEQEKLFDALKQLVKKPWFVGKLMERPYGLKSLRLDKYRIIYKVEYEKLIVFSIRSME